MYGRRRSFKPLVILLVLAALLTLPFTVVEMNLKDTILAMARVRAEQAAIKAIQEAVNEKIARAVEYKDLIFIRTDNNGRVVLMQANTIKINNLAADTTLEIQQSLAKLEGTTVPIPLGQALNSKLLASYGPKIKVTLVPMGTVKVKVEDDFQQAGINQTRHRLYLHVFSRVKIVIPLVSETVEVASQIPIAETIIIGEVPTEYVNLNLGEALGFFSKK
ncbi:MAG: sporulation protein YunB [Bacillota bacterium]